MTRLKMNTHHHIRRRHLGLLLTLGMAISALVLGGCGPTIRYSPSDQSAAVVNMSLADARKGVKEGLEPHGPDREGVSASCRSGSTDISSAEVSAIRLRITYADGTKQTIALDKIDNVSQVVNVSGYVGQPNTAALTFDNMTLNCQYGTYNNFTDVPSDQLYVLGKHARALLQGLANQDTQINASLDSYRKQAGAGGPLPDEADMYRVQAEGSIRDKKFLDAEELYGKALDIAPWWPQGHFNRALLFDATGDYQPAVAEMKMYLELVPTAANAKAAREKLYDLERKRDAEKASLL